MCASHILIALHAGYDFILLDNLTNMTISAQKCTEASLRTTVPILGLFALILTYFSGGGGGTQYKRPYGDVPPARVATPASWYMNDLSWNAKI